MEKKPGKTLDDPDSFDRQIQRPELRIRLINLARRRDVPEADCEDVASDIIAEAVRCQAEYDPQRGSVSTWIMAIGENIIRSYFRGLNAQKRKPDGGIISSDAASDADGNPLEVSDKRAEEERRSSEEAEHFLGTVKLSKREAAAIGTRRNKQPQSAGATYSPSTVRRAMKKLKQVRSDENFRDRPVGPEASECAYGNLPPAEHDTALLYDAVRRIPWFVEAIGPWRNSPQWKDLQAYLDDERAAKRFPLAILPQHWPEPFSHYRQAAHDRDPKLRRRFEQAVEIAVAFPKWPRVSYCQMEPGKRRQRLEQFGWTFGPMPFWEIDERTFEFFVNAADDAPDLTLGVAGFLKWINEVPKTDSHAYSSVHLIRIDRRYPPKTIRESFNKWLAAQLKPGSNTIYRSGRRPTTRLVGFAGIRLMDDFRLSKAQAMSWLKQQFGARVPFTPERFERAVATAREGLRDFLPSPAEMGI